MLGFGRINDAINTLYVIQQGAANVKKYIYLADPCLSELGFLCVNYNSLGIMM